LCSDRVEIFSIADRGPARIARQTRTFGDSLKRKSWVSYLPPNAADRNPGALARKHPSRDIPRARLKPSGSLEAAALRAEGVTRITIESVPAPIYTLTWVSSFMALADGTARAY
jgi:hypothetical protein